MFCYGQKSFLYLSLGDTFSTTLSFTGYKEIKPIQEKNSKIYYTSDENASSKSVYQIFFNEKDSTVIGIIRGAALMDLRYYFTYNFTKPHISSLKVGDKYPKRLNTLGYIDVTSTSYDELNAKAFQIADYKTLGQKCGALINIKVYLDLKDSTVIGIIRSNADIRNYNRKVDYDFTQPHLLNLQLGDKYSTAINILGYKDVTAPKNGEYVRVYSTTSSRAAYESGATTTFRLYLDDKDSTIIGIIRGTVIGNAKYEFAEKLQFIKDVYCKEGSAKFIEENVKISEEEHTDYFSYKENDLIITSIIFPKKEIITTFYEEQYLIKSKYNHTKVLDSFK